jgi:hypothetical protein
VLLVSAFIVAAAVVWSATRIAAALSSRSEPHAADRTAEMLALFAPGAAAVRDDLKQLLVWQPMAVTARKLFPREFAALDQAAGRTFPFSTDDLQAAHSRWTAEWLAWERSNDAECKLKVTLLEHEMGEKLNTPAGRARLDALERDKLDRYQRHYEEYTRIAKGLQALAPRL